jgi:DNA polymerase
MLRATRAGYPVILRVHDELVAETRDGSGLTWEGLAECMGTNPSWSTGLPLAAAGFDADRYRKE